MKSFILVLSGALCLGLAGAVLAATCTIGGISRTCDVVCTNADCTIQTSHCNDGAADGYCAICGTSANENIQGTDLSDWICGKGGNDVINSFVSSSSTNADSV